jgi:hypothetical protein
MKWSSAYPDAPGYYFVLESDAEPIMVQVEVVTNSHTRVYVVIPGDSRRRPIELWENALWYGPV